MHRDEHGHPDGWEWGTKSWMCVKYLTQRLLCKYSGLISYRIDWFDLLPVPRTLKSLLQHHSLKASVLRPSDFFMIQLSHSYMTTRKTIAVTIWTFVRKVMALIFNMLSRFVIAFLF